MISAKEARQVTQDDVYKYSTASIAVLFVKKTKLITVDSDPKSQDGLRSSVLLLHEHYSTVVEYIRLVDIRSQGLMR